jgi:hypothetical protein
MRELKVTTLGVTVPTGLADSVPHGFELAPRHSYTRGVTIKVAVADEEDLLPPLEATWVSVRMLLSRLAITSTSLLLALGTLMSPKRTWLPPPFAGPHAVLPLLPLLLLPAWHTTVGIR